MSDSRGETTPEEAGAHSRLVSDLHRLVALLDRHGVEHWCRWMRQALVELQRHDAHGLDRLRRAYGGMGSFNDLVLDGSSPENRRDVNAELDALRSRVYSDMTVLAHGRRRG